MPGGGEEHVLGGDQVVGDEHLLEIVAGVEGPLALRFVARGKAALDRPAQALDRGRGDDALRGTADARRSSRGRPRCPSRARP